MRIGDASSLICIRSVQSSPQVAFRIDAAGFPLVSKKGLWLELIQVVCHPLTQAETEWFLLVPLGSLDRRTAIKAGILDHGHLQRADQQRFE